MDFSSASQCFSCMYSGGTGGECAANGGELAFYGKVSACVNSSYTNASSCTTNGLTWMARHYSCSDPAYTTQFSCATNGETWQADEGVCIAPRGGAGCPSGSTLTSDVKGACTYLTTPTRCGVNGGLWDTVNVYVCSDTTYYADYAACIAHSGSWVPMPYCMISSAAACETYDGVWGQTTHTTKSACEVNSAKWQPTESVCLNIAFIADGAVAANLLSVGPVAISWNGTRTTVPFNFGANTLSHGQAAYAITKGSSCPTTVAEVTTINSFPTGAPLWTPFTYVPGTTLSFERKITQ